MQETIESLTKYWNETVKDVRQLVDDNNLFIDVIKIIEVNPNINRPNLFIEWMIVAYFHSIITSIGRLMDEKDKYPSQSLIKLLNLIIKNDSLFNSNWFIQKYTSQRQDFEKAIFIPQAKKDWQIYFGKFKNIDKNIILNDIKKIEDSCGDIKYFRDKVIAHKDTKISELVMDIKKITDAIKVIDEIAVKYEILFNQAGFYGETTASLIYSDWKEIFRKPWIIESKNNPDH